MLIEKRELIELELPEKATFQEILKITRHDIFFRIVFMYEKAWFSAIYTKPRDVNVLEDPWEFERKVEITEVKKVKKQVEVWEEK